MENNNENKYITSKDLEEQTKVIISAVDSIMEKRTKEVKGEIKGVRDELYIVRNELNEKIEGAESRLGEKIDDVHNLVDRYVKTQEDFKEEFVIVKEEEKQMKAIFKEKLGVEIRAI